MKRLLLRLSITGAALAALALASSGCKTSGQLSYNPGSGAAYEGRAQSRVADDPEEARFGREVCKDFDLKPTYAPNTVDDVDRFLRERGYEIRREDPRRDLSYLDVSGNGVRNVRLRVATLASAAEAGRDLHEAILQHGQGSWGVHRSRLAILAPRSDTANAMAFASQSKLACWGEMMIAGRDDDFVIPGAYREPLAPPGSLRAAIERDKKKNGAPGPQQRGPRRSFVVWRA